jgi:hypothetical protein
LALSKGYEVQLNSSPSEQRKTGSLYAVVDLAKSPVDETQWFKVGIRVQDKHITIHLNGEKVVDYIEPENPERPEDLAASGSARREAQSRSRRMIPGVSSTSKISGSGGYHKRCLPFFFLPPIYHMKCKDRPLLLASAVAGLLLVANTPPPAGLNLVEEGDFEELRGTEFTHWGPAGFAGGTSKIKFLAQQEGGNTFARIHVPEEQPDDSRTGSFKLSSWIAVDPQWKKLTVKARVRTKNWRKNAPSWNGAGSDGPLRRRQR